MLACLLAFAAPLPAAPPRDVLVLYPYGQMLQPNAASVHRVVDGFGFGGLAEAFAARQDIPVTLSSEFLDQARDGGAEREPGLVAFLRDKYAGAQPAVLIVVSDATLAFVLRHRAELFPNVPIVHLGVDAARLQALGPLPPDVVGTPVAYDFLGTVEQARRWHPAARRVVVVTGAGPWDREWEARLRAHAGRVPGVLGVEFLAGLPSEELDRRLRALTADAIVYTPGYLRDGGGRRFEITETVRRIAATAPVPVYGPLAGNLGTGVVGGRVASYDTMGRIAAETALAILDGATPANLQPPATLPTPLQVDWRQLERWGVPDDAVPPGTIVMFRKQSLWEANRDAVVVGIAVMLVQAALIASLLFERRRRRRTEDHMRLAANAAGLATWVFHGEDAGAGGRFRGASRGSRGDGMLADFQGTLSSIAPQDRPTVEAALQAARATRGEFAAEYRVAAGDGGWRWQAARGRVDAAQPQRMLGVAIDITERKRAELQAEQDRAGLQHMSRVSVLGQLSASIAHQLNQPLASILANIEAAKKILEREPIDVRELREICDDIATADHMAAQVIRRLGALFKRGEPLFEPLDLNDLVRDTVGLTRTMLALRHVSVTTELAAELPHLSGDRVQLQQLLLNLIINAAEAMVPLPEDRRALTIRTEAQPAAVRVCVRDRGPGVSAEAIEHLFEPFWSGKPGGMGMGLAVSRSIAEAHRGSLGVRNVPGGGAEFCLQLPLPRSP